MRNQLSRPMDEGMSPRKSTADDWELHVKERTLERLRRRLAIVARRVVTDDARLAA
jgi:hypothetical protein